MTFKTKFMMCAVLTWVTLGSSAAVTTRGISVQIKSSEAINAPVLEQVDLYDQSYALVIGIDEYTNGWPRLSNAVKDARLVARALEEKHFNVDLHENLTSSELAQVFKKFFILKGEQPQARLFVWYAGHGATVDGEGYLVPADAPVIQAGSAFKFSSVALRDFGTFMRQSVSKHVYAVFDSCFAGTVFTAQRAMPPAAITRATTLPVRQFLTSGDADQTVSDDGQFRDLFIRAITGTENSDANGDGYLTASEIGMYLGDRITNLTEAAQTPRYGKLRDRDFDRGDFVFVLPSAEAAKAQPSKEAEIVFWESIQSDPEQDELLAYINNYPNGLFTNLAKIRLGLNQSRSSQTLLNRPEIQLISDQKQYRIKAPTAVRAAPNAETQSLLQLKAGELVYGVATALMPEPWLLIARDGVTLGYIAKSLTLPSNTQPNVTMIYSKSALSESVLGAAGPAVNQSNSFQDRFSQTLDNLLDASNVNDPQSSVRPLEPVQRLPLNDSPDRAEITPGVLDRAENSARTSEKKVNPSEPQPLNAAQESNRAKAETSSPAVPVATTDSDLKTLLAQSGEGDPQATVHIKAAPVAHEQAFNQPLERTESMPIRSDRELRATGSAGDDQDKENTASNTRAASESLEKPLATDPNSDSSLLESDLSAPILDDNGGTTDAFNTVVEFKPSGLQQMNAEPEAVDTLKTQSSVQASEVSIKPPPESKPEPEPKPEDEDWRLLRLDINKPQLATSDTEQKFSEFFRRYLLAAARGNQDAQFSLGYMYETGERVDQDLVEATRWYTRAAEQDNQQAILSLANLLIDTEDPRRQSEAIDWYKKAGELGNADAQEILGYQYQTGRVVKADMAIAARWYLEAARQGRPAAQNNLARLYQLGQGTEKDLDQAIYWYEKAAALGSEAARNNLRELLPKN